MTFVAVVQAALRQVMLKSVAGQEERAEMMDELRTVEEGLQDPQSEFRG